MNKVSKNSDVVKRERRGKKRHKRGRKIDGVLLLDKSGGITSNGALQRIKSIFYAAKAGHTGSLDPLATGVLPICFGEATKFSRFLLEADKSYLAKVKLGETTDTGDSDGQQLSRVELESYDLSLTRIKSVLTRFLGPIEQIPSMFSAIKHQGRPLYEWARQGIEIERAPRSVTIYHLELKSYELPFIEIEVKCSKGTYIRTLAEDIGKELGCGAHIQALRRTEAGPFSLDQSYTLEYLQTLYEEKYFEQLNGLLLPVDVLVEKWPAVTLSENLLYYVRQGHPVQMQNLPAHGWVRLMGDDKTFIGVGEILNDGRVAPRRLVI